jgi:GR25 family glycosyltransferase involved in LPS biosynthesis
MSHSLLTNDLSSHVKSSSSIVAKPESQEWYLILEDDAGLRARDYETLKRSLGSLVASLPIEADILYLGHNIPKKATQYRKGGGNKFIKPNYITELHAYLITRKTAGILLSFLPVDCPVDIFLARLIHDKIITV